MINIFFFKFQAQIINIKTVLPPIKKDHPP